MLDGKKTLFSGMQATGTITLGNYLGALKNWVNMDPDEYKCFYGIMDLHSITVRQDPASLRKSARNLLMLYIFHQDLYIRCILLFCHRSLHLLSNRI